MSAQVLLLGALYASIVAFGFSINADSVLGIVLSVLVFAGVLAYQFFTRAFGAGIAFLKNASGTTNAPQSSGFFASVVASVLLLLASLMGGWLWLAALPVTAYALYRYNEFVEYVADREDESGNV